MSTQYSFGAIERSIPTGIELDAIVKTLKAPNNGNCDFSYRMCKVLAVLPETAQVEVEIVDGFWSGQTVTMYAEDCVPAVSLNGFDVASTASEVRAAWEFVNVRRRNETTSAYYARFEKYFYDNYQTFTLGN